VSTAALDRYYRAHARIYDLTRPAFLFGRRQLVLEAYARLKPRRVLEIGCGTGWLLGEFAALDSSIELTGVDLSSDMLERARKRLGDRAKLLERRYSEPLSGDFDLVVMSYMLTMTGSACASIVATASRDLRAGGALAVVDFDATPVPAFARWMRLNHVQMTGQVRHAIDAMGAPLWSQTRACYGGLWRRYSAIARPRATAG
jgi:S-adenosylmethionine-diacylgycerolhomoserine-N-methlytransferase